MQLHPDTDISGSLNPYFKYPDSTVQLVCQLTYYHFSYYLHQSNPGSIDSPDTISNYTQLLSMASKSKHYVAKMDKLFIDATDLLKVLQCLSSCPKNRQFLIENSEFHKAITNLLLRDGKKEIECALDLLLTYLTEGQPIALTSTVKKRGRKEQLPLEDNREQARTQLLSYFPKLIDQLKSILASQLGVNCFKQLCSALLWCLQTNPGKLQARVMISFIIMHDCFNTDNDINSCFLYVQCCYEYKHYGECCYWSDYITQQCTANPEAKRLWDCFLLYKAKAKYHIYQRQHVVLRRSETLQSLGEMKQDRERVYEDTKDVISILGSLKVKKFPLDLKCEQFFDYALMDYIRELNKRSSKDSIYCMLCHKKQTVVRSHTVPEAVLKIIFKKNQEVVMMGPSSQSFDSRVKNPHTLTFNMLCSSCDNEVLSRDENLFLENIVKPIYQASSISHLEKFDKILYDKWLHRFCAGIIFRNLALSRGVVGSANANDIHKLFCYCRDIINPSTQENSSKQLLPKNIQIAMFFTPGMLDDQASDHEMSSNLIRALNSNVFCHLSNVPISGISSNLARKHYFFAVHFGIFNIVAFLEPLATKYHRFLVDPCKGEFSIPANSDRLSFIPPGLMKIFKEQSEKSVRQYLERLVEVSKEKKDISLTVLKSNVDGSPIGQPTSFSLLPQKYELNRQTNVITVKEGHLILLHTTHQLPSASHTVFLAVEEINPTKPYVIIHSHLDAPTMSQTFGYYITLPEFGFKAELDDNHKVLMHHIRSKNLDLFKLPAKMIPIMLQQAGLQNYQSILYHLYR